VIYIYEVHLSGGSRHEHISSVRWKNPDNRTSGQTTREEMVRWVRGGGAAYVCGNHHLARVALVNAEPPYLRTHADGDWNDNLLALPRY
jgi:hypothetical protein